MTFDIDRRETFDSVAELYDSARPGYPAQLFDDIIALSGIADDGTMLEIGCGTGKATISFAQRGNSMHCLELGENLAALAAHNCRAYPAVRIEQAAFEEWSLSSGSFDLVFSAQAFHWIPIEIAYAKSAAALKPGGYLALFWNTYPVEDAPLRHELDEIYLRHAPEIADRGATRTVEEKCVQISAFINDSGHFGPVEVRYFPWSEIYSADQYISLLNTYSDHISLTDTKRRELFAGIRSLIDRQGGVIERPYLAVLFCAQVM